MGVPGFFSWLLKKYKSNILSQTIERPHSLYIDANCLFHPKCFEIANNQTITNNDNLELLMHENIINYIEVLINHVKPTKYTYIAVDGVAPVAKINQQRMRRYKSIYEEQIKNAIKETHNIKKDKCWTNAVITPGTEFMETLHVKLLEYSKNSKHNIIYSSYHCHGEGEHKILQHIKNRSVDKRYVIYGLDADLIFLAMASNKPNIYLLRETNQIEKNNTTNDFVYFNVDKSINLYNKEIKDMIDIPEFNNIKDFIFLCFLLGNDFMPNIPCLDINRHGLDILLKCYAKHYVKNGPLIDNDNKINNKYFCDILSELTIHEDEYYKYKLSNYIKKNQIYVNNSLNSINDAYKRDVYMLENLIHDENNKTFKLGNFVDVNDKVNFLGRNHKQRYYSHYMGNGYDLGDICYRYLEGLVWINTYYFDKCESWQWQYCYHNVPYVSDLLYFIRKYNFDINSIMIKKSKHINIFEQLLSVIPPQRKYIIPKSLRKIMSMDDLSHLFPNKFDIDIINKDKFWKCHAVLPLLNIKVIKEKVIENIDDINISELIRNETQPEYYFTQNKNRIS